MTRFREYMKSMVFGTTKGNLSIVPIQIQDRGSSNTPIDPAPISARFVIKSRQVETPVLSLSRPSTRVGETGSRRWLSSSKQEIDLRENN